MFCFKGERFWNYFRSGHFFHHIAYKILFSKVVCYQAKWHSVFNGRRRSTIILMWNIKFVQTYTAPGRSQFLRHMDEIWCIFAFWSKEECYWKGFVSVDFFDNFTYNGLLWKVGIWITVGWCRVFSDRPWPIISISMFQTGMKDFFFFFLTEIGSLYGKKTLFSIISCESWFIIVESGREINLTEFEPRRSIF